MEDLRRKTAQHFHGKAIAFSHYWTCPCLYLSMDQMYLTPYFWSLSLKIFAFVNFTLHAVFSPDAPKKRKQAKELEEIVEQMEVEEGDA